MPVVDTGLTVSDDLDTDCGRDGAPSNLSTRSHEPVDASAYNRREKLYCSLFLTPPGPWEPITGATKAFESTQPEAVRAD